MTYTDKYNKNNKIMKKIIGIIAVSLVSSIFTASLFYIFMPKEQEKSSIEAINSNHAQRVSLGALPVPPDIDFTNAAEKSLNAVVHVKTKFTQEYRSNPLMDFFFGYESQSYSRTVPLSSGSGVIISNDGYIVTNNHVIDNSDYIEVILNDKRSYKAKLVGKDQSTDIALLKIDAGELPFLTYGNSDNLKVGEWVLAVGNPFNLNSTVTAGIISAKARDINILDNSFGIESFIQTDAAVNPGNSGGALVNNAGELIGVNTAIASKTGSFVGYSFAIPVNIVKKIINDIIEFGEVQRAYLNINIADINSEIAKELELDKIEGVFVADVHKDGAAELAGLLKGDIITKVESITVNTVAQLLEQISKYRPGDKINITVKREGKEKNYKVELRNKFGNTDVVKTGEIEFLGAKLGEVPTNIKRRLRLNFGVQITELNSGLLAKKGVREGFIITSINKNRIYAPDDVLTIVNANEDSNAYLIEGVYPNGVTSYFLIGK